MPDDPLFPDASPKSARPADWGGEPNRDVWERGVIEKLAFSALREQRAARRWGIFFKALVLLYLTAALIFAFGFGSMSPDKSPTGRHTAVVQIDGEIERKGLASAEKVNSALNSAFRAGGTAGVILRINSPGGSPVQAGMISAEMLRLRREFPEIPLYVVVEELCASAAYYVAAASDQVFVDKASLVGSIGVLMNSFDLTRAMDKLGVERRELISGRNKSIGDPFSPMTPDQRQHIQGMLGEIHEQFIAVVREGRGARLKESSELFSGLFWTGATSVRLGLADGLGTVESVAREVIKAETLVDYSIKENLAERFAQRFGAALGGGMIESVTSRWTLR